MKLRQAFSLVPLLVFALFAQSLPAQTNSIPSQLRQGSVQGDQGTNQKALANKRAGKDTSTGRTEQPSTSQSFKLPEASLLILILTASCYLLTYWYESGFCNYFNVNPAFIHANLFTMLGYGVGGILALALLLTPIALLVNYGTTNQLVPTTTALIFGTISILIVEWMRKFKDRTLLLALIIFWACLLIPPSRNYLINHTPALAPVITESFS